MNTNYGSGIIGEAICNEKWIDFTYVAYTHRTVGPTWSSKFELIRQDNMWLVDSMGKFIEFNFFMFQFHIARTYSSFDSRPLTCSSLYHFCIKHQPNERAEKSERSRDQKAMITENLVDCVSFCPSSLSVRFACIHKTLFQSKFSTVCELEHDDHKFSFKSIINIFVFFSSPVCYLFHNCCFVLSSWAERVGVSRAH